MRVWEIAAAMLTCPIAGLAGQSDIACATTNVLDEKAVCAWDAYREANVQVIKLINRALIVVDAHEAAMTPDQAGEARRLLVEGHEAWQAYRTDTCDLEAHLFFGGPGAKLAYARCLARVTEQRVRDLQVIVEAD